jgi:hypothetical protein
MGKAIEKGVRLDRVLLEPHKRAMTLIEGAKMADGQETAAKLEHWTLPKLVFRACEELSMRRNLGDS